MPDELEPLQPAEEALEQDQELAEEIVGEEIVEAPESQEDKTWKGRLTKHQEETNRKFDLQDAQLAPIGYKVNRDNGAIVPLQGVQPQQYQSPPAQTTAPATEYMPEDLYDETRAPDYIKTLARQEARSMLAEFAPEILGLIDEVRAPEYEDWSEIGADVTSSLRQLGFAGVTHAKKINPAALEFAVDAARGKRLRPGGVAPASPAPRVDPARQEAIAVAASAGDGGSELANGSVNLTSEERAWAKANNMTDTQYIDFIAGPATIRRNK